MAHTTIPSDRAMLGYLAGLFDTEGDLCWQWRTDRANSIRLTIYHTEKAVMDWLTATLNCGEVRWDTNPFELYDWKPAARWEVNDTRDAVALLTAILPFLIIKRALATTVLADLTRNTKKRITTSLQSLCSQCLKPSPLGLQIGLQNGHYATVCSDCYEKLPVQQRTRAGLSRGRLHMPAVRTQAPPL